MTMTELEEIEDEMRRRDDPITTAPELADHFGASDTHIRDQLKLLKRAGAVGKKDVGARATAWWHESRVTGPNLPPEEHPDQSALGEQPARERASSAESETTSDDAPETPPWERVDLPDLSGTDVKQQDREAALRAILKRVYEADDSGAAGVYEATHDEHTTHYASADSWRSNCAGPALSELADRGVVQLVDRAEGRYRWGDA
jgi:hypothetical protein